RSDRRLVVRVYAEEVDGEIIVTYQVDLEVEIYEDVEYVGLDHLNQEIVNGLIGYYPGRRTTRTEAEAMRMLLLARYQRDGYTFCNIELQDMPVLSDGDTEATIGDGRISPGASGPRKQLRVLVEEGPQVTI